MKVHHLNCATLEPIFKRLMFGNVPAEDRRMICHCLLIESDDGLILVDSGIGMADIQANRLGGMFRRIAGPHFLVEETAQHQVQALGFKVSDVRHIVLTHLDLDHAGGLSDFPDAKVHVFADEHAAAMNPKAMEKQRYLASQYAHGVDWVLHNEEAGEAWRGLEKVRVLPNLAPELLLVPMRGHTRGHCAVAVDTGDGWLVHCGDAYFHRDEMNAEQPRCPCGLSLFQRVVQVDKTARLGNQERLRTLGKDSDVTLFSAHDVVEFRRLSGQLAG